MDKSKKLGRRSIPRRTRLHEQLEERILFDAAPDATFEVHQVVPEEMFAPVVDGSIDMSVNAAVAADQSPQQSRNEIVFVDKGVENYQQLVAELVATNGAEVHFLDPRTDGVSQIADAMANQADIDAIHLISHGTVGKLNLGSVVLTADSITGEHSDELADIRNALSVNADLLIYGCNFGEGSAGRAAAEALARATGADVAASSDLTGDSLQGGDWDLELTLGGIETEAFAIGGYHGVLGTLVSLTDDQGSDTADGVGNGDGGPSFDITEFGVDYANLASGSLNVHVQVDGDTGVESFVSVLFDIDGDLFADFDYMATSDSATGLDTFILYHGANDSNSFKISGKSTAVATLDPSDSLLMDSTATLGVGVNPFTGDADTAFQMTLDLDEIVDYYNNNIKKASDPALTYNDVKLLNVATHASASPTSTTKDQGLADGSAPYAADDDGAATTEDTDVTLDVLANDNRLGYTTVAVNTGPANGTAEVNADGTITYSPDEHYSGPDTFIYEATAIDGTVHSAEVTIAVSPVADTPTIAAADAAGSAGLPVSLSIANSLVDTDGSESLGSVTISGAASSLTFSSTTGTVTNNGGGTWTISQSALAGLSVTGTAAGTFNLLAAVTATDAVDLTGDGDATDAGETDTASSSNPFTVTLSVPPLPPSVDLNGPAAGADYSTAYTEGDAPVAIADAPLLSDLDSTHLSGATLTISNLADGDREVLALGGLPFSLGTASSQTVTVGGSTFLINYDGAGGFSIALNGTGDMPLADLQLLLAGATYQNTSQDPADGSRSIEVVVTDPSGAAGSATSTVDVNPVNDPPMLDLNGAAGGSDFSLTFEEGSPPAAFADGAILSDVDDSDMASVTIVPGGIVNGANEILTFNGDSGDSISFGMDGLPAPSQQITINGVTLDVAYDGTTFTITNAAGGISAGDVQALLNDATYQNTTSEAIPGARTLTISANDGDADSNLAVATISVIPDYLSTASSKLHTNEDTSVPLGLTIDPDLYSGGPLEDIVGVATGYRPDTAGAAGTAFTIPDNVTSVLITGYSNRPNDTGANDIYNDDYQILSARIDLASATSSGTLAHIANLANNGSRVADQYSWQGAELGTSVLNGTATIDGDHSSGTDPLFRVIGSTLEIVENHNLQTAYHVEFMTSNRDSTNYLGTISDVQQPGDTSSVFTVPAGTSYLVLNEHAAAPGSNFRQEYKDYSRIVIDLDSMTASGVIAAERGETGSNTVAYSFEGYDLSASTPGGILGVASTATVVGDPSGQSAVQHSPNIYINGSGQLVVERTAAFATDFTSMYTIESYQRTGFSSIASVIESDSADALFDATAGTGEVNTLAFNVPASAQVGIFRISMATVGGNNENENMGSGFAVIDLVNGTTSGSFMNIRATTPDLVSWSDVPMADDPGTTSVDERVFFTDPGTVSNRASLGQFVDGWGGTAWFDLAENPDGTRTITFNAISDVGDNAFQDYQTHGQVTWLGNEPFVIRTGAAGGMFSHGSPVLDELGNPTGEWNIDIDDIPLLEYVPDPHFAGDAFLEIELLSTGEVERISICVHPLADTPALTVADAPVTDEDTTADLSSSVSVALVDTDGSEAVSLIEISSIPDGFSLSDGVNSFTATAASPAVDVTNWNLAGLSLTPPANYHGTVTLDVRVQTTDTVDVGGSSETDITEAADTNPGETQATGSFDVTFLPVANPPTIDLDSSGPGSEFSNSFVEGGGPVGVSDVDPAVVDDDDATVTSLIITPGGVADGGSETLTISGDGVSSISVSLDGSADPLQQITIGGFTFDVTYDGVALSIVGATGEMPLADIQALIAATAYENADATPTTGDRTFGFVVNDGEVDSNVAVSTISVNADAASVQWSLSGSTSADEGGAANYTLSLDMPLLQAGEQASVDLFIADLDTTSADYGGLTSAIQAAVAIRPDLAFDPATGRLTFTSSGAAMAPLTFSLSATDDSLVEGPEDFRVTLANAASSTGENVSINSLADHVITTINDTQGLGGGPDQADWSVAGDASVDEGGAASYTISLDATLQAGETAAVQLTLGDVDTSGADYGDFLAAVQAAVGARGDLSFDPASGQLTFTGSGAAMADLTFTLGANDDSFVEGPERYQVLLANAASSTAAAIGIDPAGSQVTTTINDTLGDGGPTEQAVWSFGVDQTVPEGDPGAYLLALSGSLQSGEAVTVDLALTDIDTVGGDYASFDDAVADAVAAYNAGGNPGSVAWDGTTLAFTSDGSGPMAALPILLGTINDVAAEGAEDFRITLSNANSPTGAATVIDVTQDDALTTIDDTSGPGADDVNWSVAGPSTVDEGGAAAYTISLSGVAGAGQTAFVDLSLADLDTTDADHADFDDAVADAVAAYNAGGNPGSVAWDGTTLTFTSSGAAMANLVVSLGATNDTRLEGPEQFRISLADAGSTTAIVVGIDPLANTVVTTIDDTAGDGGPEEPGGVWSIGGTTSVDEGSDGSYTVSLSGDLQSGESSSVELSLADLETAAIDYADFDAAVTAAVAAYNGDPSNNGSLSWDGLTLQFSSDGSGPMSGLVIALGTNIDSSVEGPERLRLDLSNPLSATGLSPAVSATQGSVTTTIVDNEDATWSIAGAASIDEGAAGTYQVSLSGLPQAGEQISIQLGLTDLDTTGADYADFASAVAAAVASRGDLAFDPASGVLTFTSSGAAMADLQFGLSATTDPLAEGPENLQVTLSGPTSATGAGVLLDPAAERVTTTINDQTAPSQWNIAGPAIGDEGTNAVYSVSLSGALGAGEWVSVDLDLTDINTNSSDYGDVLAAIQTAADADPQVTFNAATGTLTFSAAIDGDMMSDLLITLPLTDDGLIEGVETFSISLSNAYSATAAPTGIANASVTTTIDDTQGAGGPVDGPASWAISGPSDSDEGSTAQYVIFLGGAFGIGETATVELNLADLGANVGDYGDVLAAIQAAADANPDVTFDPISGTLTFLSPSDGATMSDLLIDLPLINDSLVEGDEDFELVLSNADTSTGIAVQVDPAADQVITTINDTQGLGGGPDQADWSVEGDASVDEGGAASYTISLDATLQAGETATVQLTLGDVDTSGADYGDFLDAVQAAVGARGDLSFDLPSGQLTFTSSGAAMADLTFTLGANDDSFVEGPERYQVLLANAASSTAAAIGIDPAGSQVTTTINDTLGDGGPSEQAVWSFGVDQTVSEGDPGAYLLALSGSLQSGEVVTVDLALTDIDTVGGDYDSFDDAVADAVAAYNAGGNPGSVAWDGTTLTFSSDGSGPMAALPILLGTINDVVAEGAEDFRITLSNANSPTGVATVIDVTQDDALTTIDDTSGPGADDVNWGVAGPATVDEGGAAAYTISLGGLAGAGQTAFVDLSLVDLDTTAADYADFTTAVLTAIDTRSDLGFDSATGRLTFTSSGAAMADLVVSLGATNDTRLEGPEQFRISLTDAGSTTAIAVGIDPLSDLVLTTINDTAADGGPTEPGGVWSVSGTASVDEGSAGSYTVSLSGDLQSGESTSVELSLADLETGAIDYADFDAAVTAAVAAYNGDPSANGSLSWDGLTLQFTSDGSGPMSGLEIALGTNDDSSVEGPERLRLDLSNPLSATGLSPAVSPIQGSITTTIVDNENATWSIAGPAAVDEGATGTFTVSLAGLPQAGEQISIQLGLADLDTSGADYADFLATVATAVASRSDLVFDAATGALTFTGTGAPMADLVIDLAIINDPLVEGDEQFQIQLANPTSSTGAGVQLDPVADQVTTTINDTQGPGGDPDAARWSIAGPGSVDEGAASQYTVSLAGVLQTGENATVQISLTDIGTTSGDHGDFVTAVQAAVAAHTGPGVLSFDPASGELTFIGDGNPMDDLVIDLAIVDDTILEGPESLQVQLSSAASTTGAEVEIANGQVSTTIDDTQGPGGSPEGPALWTVSGPAAVDEGADAVFTIGLSETLQSGEAASVEIDFSDIDTDSGDHADFLVAIQAAVALRPDLSFDPASGTLTYTSDGTPMSDLSIRLPILDDSFVEGPEDFQVFLANPTTTTGIGLAVDPAAASMTTTINDTQGPGGGLDEADWSIVGDGSVDEGGTAGYTIALDATLQAGEVSTIELALSDIESDSSDRGDFIAAVQAAILGRAELSFDPATGTLTYTSDGTPLADIPITLAIGDDALAEGPERYRISLANSQSPTGSVINIDPSNSAMSTTINDTVGDGGANEQPTWSLSGPLLVDEGDTAQFTVALSGTLQAGEIVSVGLWLDDLSTNPADRADFLTAVQAAVVGRPELAFDPVTNTLTYTGDGTPMADLVVNLAVNDDIFVEGPEDFRVQLSSPASPTGVDVVLNLAADDVTTTINDADATAGVDDAAWSIAGDSQVTEGGTASYTISLSGTLQADETALVDLGLSDLDTAGADYANFVAAVQAAIVGRPDLSFSPATGTLTYTGDGTPMADMVISLNAVDDLLVEGPERYLIAMSNATSTTGAAIGTSNADSVTTTIQDTVGPGGEPEAATWSITGTTSVDEGGTAAYTVRLAGTLQTDEQASVALALTDIDSNSSDHADFAAAVQSAIFGRTDLSFDDGTGLLTYTGDGAVMADLVITIGATDDPFVEGPELLNVGLSGPASSTGAAVLVDADLDDVDTTINDTIGDGGADETGSWSITGPGDVDEGETSILTVALAGVLQAGETAYVNLGLADVDTTGADHGDFVAAVQAAILGRPELSFDPDTGRLTYVGDGTQMTPLSIGLPTTDDGFTEGPEDYQVTLSNPGSSTGAAIDVDPANGQAAVTINDTQGLDGAPDSADWSIRGSGSVAEGGFASYVISLGGVLQAGEDAAIELNLTDVDTTSTDYADFVAAVQEAIAGRSELSFDAASGTLTFVGDGTPMQDIRFTLPALIDQTVEGDESYQITLLNPASSTEAPIGVDAGVATTVIEDREPANPADPNNAPPIANDDAAFTLQGVPVDGHLLSNDGDPDGESIAINTTPVAGPGNGVVVINPDGTFTYSPNPGFTGVDTFEYQVTDAAGNIDTAVVTIEVSADANGPANNDPHANHDAGITGKNTPVDGNLLANDSDPNGDALSLINPDTGLPMAIGDSVTISTPNGQVVLRGDGSYTFTPNDDFVGNDRFTYTIDDSQGGTSTASVWIAVFDNPPLAGDDVNSTTAGAAVGGNVLVNDMDPNPNDDLVVGSVNGQPVGAFVSTPNGVVVMDADGSYVFTPDSGFKGVETFVYEVCDESGNCQAATVTIAIADISVSKQVTAIVPNGEDFDVTFQLTVENTGGAPLSDLALSEDLVTQFGPAFVSVGDPVLDASGITTGAAPSLNPNWRSDTSLDMLDPSFIGELLNPGESFSLTFVVTVDPDAGGASEPRSNQAAVGAVDTTTSTPLVIGDNSDSGGDPAGSNPGDPGDAGTSDDPTPLLIGDAGVAKQVVDVQRFGNGFHLTLEFTLENTGTVTLDQLQLHDDLMTQFGSHFGYIVEAPEIVGSTASVDPNLNPAWEGDTSQNMLDGSSGELRPGEWITVRLVVHAQPAGAGAAELINQATGGGRGLNPDGSPLTTPGGSAAPPVVDLSDTGSDPNGSNPDAPDDTGATDDPTRLPLTFFTFDSFNNFVDGFGDEPEVTAGQQVNLSQQISTLAPEPIFSGSARPGTQIIGRIFDSAGHVVAEQLALADPGGNWMMLMHNSRSLDHYRIEFVEVAGHEDAFSPHGDIFGYLGIDSHGDNYAALEPVTSYVHQYTEGWVFGNSSDVSLMAAHRSNANPLGFGV